MKINNLGYLLREGIRGIFLHGFESFAAICVTVACLLIVGTFSILTYNLNIMVEDLNKTNEILVFADETLTEAEAKSIGTKINRLDNVFQSQFVSREQALENFIADHAEEQASFAGIHAEDLRHRFVVTLEDNALMQQTVELIEAIPGVVKINAEYEMAEGFITVQRILQLVSVTVVALLLVVSLLIISNTVKLAMFDRRDEIAIMKMVGATNGFIRLPFVVEGFTLGMLAASVGFFIEWGAYDAVVEQIASIDTFGLMKLVPFEQLLIPMVATFAAAGVFVGLVGSWTSIQKFLNV